MVWRSTNTTHNYQHIAHIYPLSPHDALKHNFTSLETDLIFLQLRVLEVENCDSNSRFVVDEDENGKFMLERVKEMS